MEIIHAIVDRGEIVEQRYVLNFKKFNMVINLEEDSQNDFEIQFGIREILKKPIQMGDWIYSPGTEWGGEVKGVIRTGDTVKIVGLNFRGRLALRAITPAPIINAQSWNGNFRNHVVFENTDVSEIVYNLYRLSYSDNSQEDLFLTIDKEPCGVLATTNVRFSNFLEHITSLLRDIGLRLEIKHQYSDNLVVYSVAVKTVTDYSEELRIDEESNFETESTNSYVNHRQFCLCLGKGEMEQRETVLLKRNEDGTITTTSPIESPNYLGSLIFYDYPSAETTEDLIEGGIKRLSEYAPIKHNDFIVKNGIELHLGDIIGGRDKVTGIYGKGEVVSKELTIDEFGERIEYKIDAKRDYY